VGTVKVKQGEARNWIQMTEIESADRQIATFCEACLHLFMQTPPPLLYHYTTSAGMIGILHSNRLWAHDATAQNDAAEIRYAASVMRAHIDRAYATEYSDTACLLFDALRARLSAAGSSRAHIVSLVLNGDAEHMWRLYGERGNGCSFGFPTHIAGEWGPGWYLLRCNYSEDDLNSFCRYSLALIRTIFAHAMVADPFAKPEVYANLFFDHVALFGLLFKSKIWSDEQEWRLVKIVPLNERKEGPHGKHYIEAPSPERGRLEIGAVCVGPNTAEPKTRALQQILHQTGYGNVPVHLSMVHPIRSIP
jgi:hypothetical protein